MNDQPIRFTLPKGTIKGSRVLTYRQIRDAQACLAGRERFRQAWGSSVVVDNDWPTRFLDAGFNRGDAFWLGCNHQMGAFSANGDWHLGCLGCPNDWSPIFQAVSCDQVDPLASRFWRGSHADSLEAWEMMERHWTFIFAATWAALYVAAGD
jgi:hypothetical protein